MNYQQFTENIKSIIPVGTIIPNPGGGISTILSYSDKNIGYKRGNSRITIAFQDLYDTYVAFKGRKVKTTDLMSYAPKIFDSTRGGHSCNCTFLFSILNKLGKAGEIIGEGKAHHPFYAIIKA